MRKVNVLVCDDQPEVVEQTKELLLRYEDQFGHAMCILGVTSYDEAESFDADLLFLDIEMPGKSGLVNLGGTTWSRSSLGRVPGGVLPTLPSRAK